MNFENQGIIKRLADQYGPENLAVVLGNGFKTFKLLNRSAPFKRFDGLSYLNYLNSSKSFLAGRATYDKDF